MIYTIGLLLTPVYLVCLFISLKFLWGSEGKDERGRQISYMALLYSFPVFPIGYLLTESYHNYIQELSFETYRDCMLGARWLDFYCARRSYLCLEEENIKRESSH
ncbi:hypothetical protein [Radiobacillus deserti]|uniref:Uncharacterized protein n=1 Tax=Radiobacillus deserti TaxID=2594883 RepID=A0A516KDN3_9BACI|nr:hypothetical protein [Radiobacillus deserti]QDP39508.1 hypothetical protein FN924_04550 [Radiobacillus deserti]